MNNKIKFIIYRYFLYSLMAFEVVLLPKVINDKTVYATLDYYKYLVSMIPLLLMGIHSGYLKNVYNNNKDLRIELIKSGFLLLLATSIIVSVLFGKFLLVILIVSNGMAIFYEKIFQKDSKYLRAISFKPILSVLVITIMLIFHESLTSNNIINYLAIPYFLAIILFAQKELKYLIIKCDTHLLINGSKDLIKSGFWLNLGTLIISIYYIVDRSILKEINPIELANYAFAFNISQGFFIFFTGIAFINENNYGANIQNLTKKWFLSELKKTLGYYFVLFMVAIASFLFIVTYFLPNYRESSTFFLLIMLSWGFYYASSVLFPLLQYLNLQKKASIVLISILVLNIISYKILQNNLINYSGKFLVAQSSFFIFILTIIFLRMIYLKISKKDVYNSTKN